MSEEGPEIEIVASEDIITGEESRCRGPTIHNTDNDSATTAAVTAFVKHKDKLTQSSLSLLKDDLSPNALSPYTEKATSCCSNLSNLSGELLETTTQVGKHFFSLNDRDGTLEDQDGGHTTTTQSGSRSIVVQKRDCY